MQTLQQETRVTRDRDGWHASTRIELTPPRILEIRTRRHSNANQLVTRATVSTLRDGFLSHAVGYGTAGGDFSRHVLAEPKPRITERVVRAQHAAALERLDEIRRAIDAHYAPQQQSKDAKAVGPDTASH